MTLPTFEILRKLAVALNISADALLFEDGERGPGDDLRLHFEVTQRLDPDERRVVRDVIDGSLLKHEARRMLSTPEAAAS